MRMVEGMEFRKYEVPVDLYGGLRVKQTYRPSLEPIDSLDALLPALRVKIPKESMRIGLTHVPSNMIEQNRGGFVGTGFDHGQDWTWVVAQLPGERYVALGQYVPKTGYARAPPSVGLEHCVGAR